MDKTQETERLRQDKERYRLLCEQEPSIPLFMQHWWMDAVCAGKRWEVMLTSNEEGRIIAAMPYLIGKRAAMKYVLQPQETQLGGIWIAPDLVDDQAVVEHVADDMAERIDRLGLAYYYQQYPIGSPFPALLHARHRFKTRQRFTFRINDLSNLDDVIRHFSKNKRRQINKAISSHVDLDMTADEFYQFHSDCLAERKKKISYTREFLVVLHTTAVKRNQGQIIAIRSADGVAQAAAFVVWDAGTTYYLIPCYSPAHKDSGASALLALEAIKFAHAHSTAFDFEGGMVRGVGNHYRQFGSVRTPYYSVRKFYNPFFRLALLINRLRTRNQ